MGREELVTRLPSRELTGWAALFLVHGEEADEARHRSDAADGDVIIHGRDDDEDDDDHDDGETE